MSSVISILESCRRKSVTSTKPHLAAQKNGSGSSIYLIYQKRRFHVARPHRCLFQAT
jgi:hypothetical protein